MLYFLFLRIKNGKQFFIVKYVFCVSFLENKKIFLKTVSNKR